MQLIESKIGVKMVGHWVVKTQFKGNAAFPVIMECLSTIKAIISDFTNLKGLSNLMLPPCLPQKDICIGNMV